MDFREDMVGTWRSARGWSHYGRLGAAGFSGQGIVTLFANNALLMETTSIRFGSWTVASADNVMADRASGCDNIASTSYHSITITVLVCQK